MTGYIYAPMGMRRGGRYGTQPTVDHLCHAVSTLTALHGTPPTMRELARHLGVTYARISQLVDVAESQGRMMPCRGHRTLRVLTPS